MAALGVPVWKFSQRATWALQHCLSQFCLLLPLANKSWTPFHKVIKLCLKTNEAILSPAGQVAHNFSTPIVKHTFASFNSFVASLSPFAPVPALPSSFSSCSCCLPAWCIYREQQYPLSLLLLRLTSQILFASSLTNQLSLLFLQFQPGLILRKHELSQWFADSKTRFC